MLEVLCHPHESLTHNRWELREGERPIQKKYTDIYRYVPYNLKLYAPHLNSVPTSISRNPHVEFMVALHTLQCNTAGYATGGGQPIIQKWRLYMQ